MIGYRIVYSRAQPGERACIIRRNKRGVYVTESTPFRAGAIVYRFEQRHKQEDGGTLTSSIPFRHIEHAWTWGAVVAGEPIE